MNDLKSQVTPLTRGLIWLTQDEANTTNPHFGEIDYLLDGLLTANLKLSQGLSSRVLIGQNFGKSLYVMIVREAKASELDSFVSLFKNELGPENDILVIDEQNGFSKIKGDLKEIANQVKLIQ